MRVRVRGFVGRQLIFQESLEVEEADLERLAAEHMKQMSPYPRHMIEFEFLDELDPNERFFRLGTDPSRMVWPIGWKWRP